MIETIEYLTKLQIKLRGFMSRETEAGATQQQVFEAVAHAMSDKLNTPTSPSWVANFAKSQPRNLAHGSIARTQNLEKLIENHIHIWG